jgi:hypothetical protein
MSWTYAALRSFSWPLYSQAKKSRFQTSAKPSPPPALTTRFSKAYWEPVGSASCGVGSPSIRQRSMKCSWEAAVSVVVTPRHFAAKAAGVSVGCGKGALVLALSTGEATAVPERVTEVERLRRFQE